MGGQSPETPSGEGGAGSSVNRCPSCHSIAGAPVLQGFDFDQGEERFELVRCESCGLVRTAPRPIDLGRWYARNYYGGGNRKFSGFVENLTRRFAVGRARRIAGLASPAAGRIRVLDIGCGRGSLLRAFASIGHECHGVERGEFPGSTEGGYTLHVGDLREIAFPERHFDVVVLWHVLEHLDDPGGVLREVARIVRPGGAVVVEVPNLDSFQARWFGRHWFHLDLPRHLVHYTPTTLDEALAGAGLRTVRMATGSLEQGPFGFIQSALNVAFPRRPNQLYRALMAGSGKGAWLIAAALLVPLAAMEWLVAQLLGRGATVMAVATRANDGGQP